jgi:hypothetical protein
VASERIPACAAYLVDNAVPNVAEVVRRIRGASSRDWDVLFDRALESSRASLCPIRIRSILRPFGDGLTEEAFASAVRLHNEAITSAVKDRRIWDRRTTPQTWRGILRFVAIDHIWNWAQGRGMDLNEVFRLLERHAQ